MKNGGVNKGSVHTNTEPYKAKYKNSCNRSIPNLSVFLI